MKLTLKTQRDRADTKAAWERRRAEQLWRHGEGPLPTHMEEPQRVLFSLDPDDEHGHHDELGGDLYGYHGPAR